MSRRFPMGSIKAVLAIFLLLIAGVHPSFAQNGSQGKILGGYFEEWSIYYAGYNIANMQQNGVANKLTHLMYAFANVITTPAPACSIADSWAGLPDSISSPASAALPTRDQCMETSQPFSS